MALPARSGPPIVVLVASLGGLKAISAVLRELPRDFAAPVIVLQHLAPDQTSHLDDLLASKTDLEVVSARPGMALQEGRVTVAPPGKHLQIGDGDRCNLSSGAKVHFVCPSADVLLSSLAAGAGDRVLAVVLTGRGCDGAEGAVAVKQQGGRVIVQDPADCAAAGMPQAVIDAGAADLVLPLSEIGPTLRTWIGRQRDA
jgi:two-component system chemotaxis response regulator CheB